MALTVGWLLSQADLRLTLAAGSAGVDREIRWAHAIELGDPTPWLSGGELVLTTGMRLPRTTVLRRDYVTRLDEAGAAALGFGVGLSHNRIPDGLLAAAEGRRGFPVLAVPLPVPFVAITRAVADRLAADRMQEVRRTVDHQERMARAAIEGGVAGVIRRLARAVAGQALVTDANHVVLAAEPRDSSDLVDRLRTELVRRRRPGLRFAVASSDGRGHLTIQSLAAASVLRGYLAVATPSAPSELVRLLISHAASLVALELERPREVRAIDRRVRAIVFQLAVDGALDEVSLTRQTRLFGFPAGEPIAILAVHCPAPRLQVEDVVKRRSPSARRHTCSPMSTTGWPFSCRPPPPPTLPGTWPPPLAPGGGTSSMPASGALPRGPTSPRACGRPHSRCAQLVPSSEESSRSRILVSLAAVRHAAARVD